MFDVLVSMGSEKSRAGVRRAASVAATRGQRYGTVAERLRVDAATAHAKLASAAASVSPGHIEFIRRFWISQMVHVRADRAALLALSQCADVSLIAPNAEIEIISPVLIADAASAAGAETGLEAIGARALWARGLTGAGRLVASIDTGVEGVHPALYERWRGNDGDTASAWFDPYGGAFPADNNGHGTHVMGVMVGRTADDTIGLAHDAEWITAAVIDRGSSLATTFADILDALEWVADPDGNPETTSDVPDVVCNSWGVAQHIINPCDELFFDAIDNVEALGIVCIFAAGNEGPYSMTIRNPADRGTSPTASFAVGAVDSDDPDFPVPSFSSRGPSGCDGVSIKPELAAPGVDIRSSYKGGGYKSISGTSMAAPHVAAAVALLRQYNPDLTPEEIKLALMSSARDIGAEGEDNATGHGFLDLEAALETVRPPLVPTIHVEAVAPDLTGDAILQPGETGPLAVALSGSNASLEDLSGTLISLTAGVTVAVDWSYYGALNDGETVDNSASPFMVSLPYDFSPGDSVQFQLTLSGTPNLNGWTDTIGIMCGLPVGAAVGTVGDGNAALSVSNFGHLGLGPGSVLDAGGEGWLAQGSNANLLYESSLIVMSQDGGVAEALRQTGGAPGFDFAPQSDLGMFASGTTETVTYDDSRAELPVGVSVEQTAVHHVTDDTYSLVIVSWTIRSRTGLPIDGLRVGWLNDIDMPSVGAVGEEVLRHQPSGGVCHTATTMGAAVTGLVPLDFSFGSLRFFEDLSAQKSSLSSVDKLAAMTGGVETAPSGVGDWLEVMSTPPVDLNADDSLTIALAFITADDAAAFTAGADDARQRWIEIADINDDQTALSLVPTFRLAQNYPNPFNAATTIPITIANAPTDRVQLDVFDILGRRVRTLVDRNLSAGTHLVHWDGSDHLGRPAASGVYLFRLTVNGQTKTRQMVLLK
jgi:bacillopeptidase F